jgi:hypothetical protein
MSGGETVSRTQIPIRLITSRAGYDYLARKDGLDVLGRYNKISIALNR